MYNFHLWDSQLYDWIIMFELRFFQYLIKEYFGFRFRLIQELIAYDQVIDYDFIWRSILKAIERWFDSNNLSMSKLFINWQNRNKRINEIKKI